MAWNEAKNYQLSTHDIGINLCVTHIYNALSLQYVAMRRVVNASAGANTNWHGGRGVRMEIGAYVACMAVHVTYVHPPNLNKIFEFRPCITMHTCN